MFLLLLRCQRLIYGEAMAGFCFRLTKGKMERFLFTLNVDLGGSLLGITSWCGSKPASYSCYVAIFCIFG
ncbi:hypothetical protein NC652_004402 [Populus alba x Populus x berolinensis]|nr:hypothetical protein NC652_004402 [Populus alba x Populus x berolinensis]